MAERSLNEQQKLFLELLFTDEVGGDFVKAKKLAGYASTYPTSNLVKSLEEEIIAATKQFLSRTGPKAAMALGDLLQNPTQLGGRDKLAAAKDVLDRIGVSKTEKVEVSSHGLFILPPKKEEVVDD